MLLLQTLSTNCDFEFKKYRLAPMGSFSRIIKKDDNKTVYDLYCPSDIGFGRLFGYGTFDKGMGAFLECVQELQNFVQQVVILPSPSRLSQPRRAQPKPFLPLPIPSLELDGQGALHGTSLARCRVQSTRHSLSSEAPRTNLVPRRLIRRFLLRTGSKRIGSRN